MVKTNTVKANSPRIKKLAFEAIVKGTGIEGKPALVQELKPLFDIDRPQADYSPEVAINFMELVRERLYPGVSREKAMLELGRQCFHGFHKGTVVGGIMLTAIKVMKPQRMSSLAARMWNDVGTGHMGVEDLSATRSRASYRSFLIDPYLPLGVSLEGMAAAGVKSVSYEILELPTSSGIFCHNFDIVYELDY